MDQNFPRTQRTKKELLSELRERKDEFTKDEVLAAIGEGAVVSKEEMHARGETEKVSRHKIISMIAYSVGALVIIMGVILLGLQFWDDLDMWMRVAVTFGLGVLVFLSVILLEVTTRVPDGFKNVLSVVAATLVFFGGFVISDEMLNAGRIASESVPVVYLATALILTLMFGGLSGIRRSGTYLFFTFGFAAWMLYSLISLESIQEMAYQSMEQPGALYAYMTILIGLAYLLFAYFFSEHLNAHKKLATYLFIMGGFGFIIPFFLLGATYSTYAWDIAGLLGIIGLGLTSASLKRMDITITGGIILTLYVFSGFFRELPFLLFDLSGMIVTLLAIAFFILLGVSAHKIRGVFPHLLLMIAAFTWMLYVAVSLDVIQEAAAQMDNPSTLYLTLTSLIGLSYILLGYFLSENLSFLYNRFAGILYSLGSFALVVPLFAFSFIYTGAWDIVSALVLLGLFSLGAFIKRKSLIVSAAILLAIFIVIVSFHYFADTIGWPFALIIAGFLLMGVGYFSYTLSAKLSKDNTDRA